MSTPGDKKIIILTAPSGAGKTTIKSRMLQQMADRLSFSVSVTTRKKRDGETDGVDYFFVDETNFKNNIEQHQFIEWEMVYPGMYYGTSIEEINRIWSDNKTPVLDIDVKGAMNVKRMYGEKVLSIFIEPPSIEVLEQRLKNRGTDNPENITMRVSKAKEEMTYRNSFDKVILNDDIEKATAETKHIIQEFIG